MKSGGQREVGRYVLCAEIASGGMATVFLGRVSGAAGFTRAVAIKAMHPHRVNDRSARAQFIDEARLAARIRHQNVVPTLDVLSEDDELFIVMEYVHGLSLSQLLDALRERRESLPIDMANAIVTGALHGLHAAHEATSDTGDPLSVVHRDVSPQNILCGVDGVVRVVDFGVAKATGRLQSTVDGELKGKIAFMSPEQIQSQEVDRRTDVYAAGVVLWQALTGQRLFVGASEASLLLDVLERRVKPPSSIAAEVPAELDAIVLRALARDPADRWATAREMALAIEEVGPVATSSALGSFVRDKGGEDLARRDALLQKLETLELPAPARKASTDADGTVVIVPRRAGARWKPLAFSLLGVGLVAALVLLARPEPSVVASADVPLSSNAEAVNAYREATQAFRDGSSSLAVSAFEKALALDSSIGPAHTRLAFVLLFANPDRARTHFLRATQLRERMTLREQALLDAFEPFILRQPSDYAEYERRMTALEARHPNDAEIAYFAATARSPDATLPERANAFTRVVALDPSFNLARAGLVEIQLYAGDFPAARRTIQDCLRVAPSAVQCEVLLADLHKQSGECRELEADAQRLLAIDGSDARSYHMLASALFALGRPESAVEEALAQAWRHADVLRPHAELEDRIALAAIRGDFVAALTQAEKLDAAIDSSRVRGVHARATSILVTLLEESGDQSGAARAAKRYLDRREGWLADPRREDFAIARDPTPAFLAVSRRGSALTTDEADRQRDAWIENWQAQVLPGYRAFVWPHGRAVDADSKERALAALRALAAPKDLPRFTPMSLIGADIGRTYLLAERPADAIPWLERVAASCTALDAPVQHTRAWLWLGNAREARGDRDGACRAYAAVLSRWGRAKPRSVSADDASRRSTALGCPR